MDMFNDMIAKYGYAPTRKTKITRREALEIANFIINHYMLSTAFELSNTKGGRAWINGIMKNSRTN